MPKPGFKRISGYFLVFFIFLFFLSVNSALAADDSSRGVLCKCEPSPGHAPNDCQGTPNLCVKDASEAQQKCTPASYYVIVVCPEGKECLTYFDDKTSTNVTDCAEPPKVTKEKEFAEQPDVTLEVPFGSEGGEGSPVKGLPGYILVVYEYIVILIAIVAAVMIIWAGFKWTTSAGSSSQIASAKTIMTNAIIGLVLALTSYLLLYTINPALVNLKKLQIPMVNPKHFGCEGVAELMSKNQVIIDKPIDRAFILGDATQRDGTASWCYKSSNGKCSGPPSDNRDEVTMNPKVCEVIIAAAEALVNFGKPVIVSSIIGSHSKCAGSAECAGPAPNCTQCVGVNQSPHWEGRGVDLSYRNLQQNEIEAMNLAICNKVSGVSQIISRPNKNPTGPIWTKAGCPSASAPDHHDHTHVTIGKASSNPD